jgi:hypothetical protein
MDEM